MTVMVGVIAEDHSDIDVMDVIISKLAKKSYAIRRFVGHGSGKILSKCNSWANDLRAKGCTLLIVAHDLDSRKLAKFKPQLAQALGVSPIPQHVLVIPVQEIEAWLLADHEAILKTVKAKKTLKMIANPEASNHPKEDLRDLISRITDHRTIYVNTVHNHLIAKNAAITNLRRCTSFLDFHDFVKIHLGGGKKKK